MGMAMYYHTLQMLSKYVSSRNKGFGRTYCTTLDTYIVFIAYTNYLKYHIRDKKEAILWHLLFVRNKRFIVQSFSELSWSSNRLTIALRCYAMHESFNDFLCLLDLFSSTFLDITFNHIERALNPITTSNFWALS